MEKVSSCDCRYSIDANSKPFSYGIPKELASLVQLGSRVHVPFGKGNRLLQGFVCGWPRRSSS